MIYAVKHWLRWLRVQAPVTRLAGYHYSPAQDLIEIDITYLCNLHCANCNRSSAQAPEAVHMSVQQMAEFVDDSLAKGRRWRRIRILGGEPTLHPKFDLMIAELMRYKAASPKTLIQVVTNGHGDKVNRALRRLPPEIYVENSAKQGKRPARPPVPKHQRPAISVLFAESGTWRSVWEKCAGESTWKDGSEVA